MEEIERYRGQTIGSIDLIVGSLNLLVGFVFEGWRGMECGRGKSSERAFSERWP